MGASLVAVNGDPNSLTSRLEQAEILLTNVERVAGDRKLS